MPRILVIEDDVLMCRALTLMLSKQGHTITIAQNGKDALKFLQETQFDLIITDLMLPFASGMELISRLKMNELQGNTPVMVVSSVAHEKTIQDAFNLGADDYLKKPVTPSELISRVNRLLLKKQGIQ
ncbi:response regulator [Chitinophaga lutea]|uniref:Response regulator n=1 Tax=Chitinophaga lutea TaxID=2488634 RepID=A0A3N4Q6Y0_9BACT|nr:response regulator [Chitinophaga lutea]RPE13301.1 response regulator [Chitinophaga lutea]